MQPDLKIYRSLEEAAGSFGPCALTVGNFDGLHEGHRRIMRRVAAVAREHGWHAAAMTFDPHPAKVVAPSRAPKLLTTPERRAQLMAQEGITHVVIVPFTEELSSLEPEAFVTEILEKKLHARAVLVGDNFRFGHKHAGDVHLLKELGGRDGFLTEIIPAVTLRGHIVSSSEVRRCVRDGNVSRAMRLLDQPFALEGEVVHGFGIGSKQTVPTLNLKPDTDLLPRRGVYVTRTEDLESDRVWPSVTNVGYRPTFGGDALTVETFLLSPLEGPTPRRIRVNFLYRLRDEKKFDSPERLKSQILRDVSRANAYFRRTQRVMAAGCGKIAQRGTVKAQE